MAKKHENFGRLDDGLNVEIPGFIDEIAKSKHPLSPLKKGEGGHFTTFTGSMLFCAYRRYLLIYFDEMLYGGSLY